MRFALATTLLFLFSLQLACASKSVERASCEQADWYELGRRDGSQGLPSERLIALRKDCSKDFHSDWETMYLNGRNAGLVEFCETKNAYEMGRLGVAYLYVCPSTVEPQFLSAYRKGQTARQLEQQNQNLDLQIDQLAQKLVAESNKTQQRQITSEMDQLKKTRSRNEQQLSKIISK